MRRIYTPQLGNDVLDRMTTDAAARGATLLQVNTLVAEVRRLNRQLSDWLEYVPEGWEPVEAYRKGDQLVVCGDPVIREDIPEDHPDQHNCDAMGCSSVNHCIYRGTVKFT